MRRVMASAVEAASPWGDQALKRVVSSGCLWVIVKYNHSLGCWGLAAKWRLVAPTEGMSGLVLLTVYEGSSASRAPE